MRSAGAQFLALISGAVATGALLFAVGDVGIGATASACRPDGPGDARDHGLLSPPIRLTRITLPAPPPAATPIARAASRRSPPPAETPKARPAKPDAVLARTGTSAAKPPATPRRAPAANLASISLNAGKQQEDVGRPLLRLLEHGQGPLVEISWPSHAVARAKLYDLLRRCHGLKTVLLRDQEILMPAAAGAPEVFNGDRHSGFLRAILGPSTQREARLVQQLRTRHGAADTTPARLLSRQFDARLLGGLRRLAGPGYRGAKTVRARYAVAGKRVMVHGLLVDGRLIDGRIEIDPPGSCRRGGA